MPCTCVVEIVVIFTSKVQAPLVESTVVVFIVVCIEVVVVVPRLVVVNCLWTATIQVIGIAAITSMPGGGWALATTPSVLRLLSLAALFSGLFTVVFSEAVSTWKWCKGKFLLKKKTALLYHILSTLVPGGGWCQLLFYPDPFAFYGATASPSTLAFPEPVVVEGGGEASPDGRDESASGKVIGKDEEAAESSS